MRLVVIASDNELVFDGSDGVEDKVVEEFFTHIIPIVFLGVQVWAVGRQFDEHHIDRNVEHTWAVARCAIIDNEQKMVREAHGQFLQKHVHAVAVHGRQNEVTGVAIKRADRAVRIGIFAHDLLGRIGPTMLRHPATAWVVDAPETRLILKENLERQAYSCRFFFRLREDVRPVFLKASCRAGSPCGCRGRGAILRQPWRCRRSYTVVRATARPIFPS